jgi:Putative zinc-finger
MLWLTGNGSCRAILPRLLIAPLPAMAASDKPADYDWKPCPAGVLSSMLSCVRRRKLASRFGFAFITGLGFMCCAYLVGPVMLPQPGSIPANRSFEGHHELFASVCCSRIRKLSRKYLARSTSAELTKSIENHLESCAACREHVESVRNGTAKPAFQGSRPDDCGSR